jgi:hypothetical protein
MPDVPLSSFAMRLGSDGKGTIALGVNPCSAGGPRALAAVARLEGQNGERHALRVPIAIEARCTAGGR